MVRVGFPLRLPANWPHMFLPKRLYEALPAIYIAIGVLLILGSTYIGLGHGPGLGYFAIGLASLCAGAIVTCIRHRARSGSGSRFETRSSRVSLDNPALQTTVVFLSIAKITTRTQL